MYTENLGNCGISRISYEAILSTVFIDSSETYNLEIVSVEERETRVI